MPKNQTSRPPLGEQSPNKALVAELRAILTAGGVRPNDENSLTTRGPESSKAPSIPVAKAATATSTLAPLANGSISAPTTKKRKSATASIDIDNPAAFFPDALDSFAENDRRLVFAHEGQTCNAIRRRIRTWITSGAMPVGKFQEALGVSSKAYMGFMNRTGTWDGEGCDTYLAAARFFEKRIILGLPLKAGPAGQKKPKKAKTNSAAATSTAAAATATSGPSNVPITVAPPKIKTTVDVFDCGDAPLLGEDACTVSVYDTCDEVRKKMRAFLAQPGATQAGFARKLSTFSPPGKSVSTANLRSFMGLKGPMAGNTNTAFYAGYVFFEKRRLKEGKPKSAFRLEMETEHGRCGVNVEYNYSNGLWVLPTERGFYINKYGKMVTY